MFSFIFKSRQLWFLFPSSQNFAQLEGDEREILLVWVTLGGVRCSRRVLNRLPESRLQKETGTDPLPLL